MPKDEFDFEDPFELNGMAFMTHEDTTNDMAETFIEEFMRMGYGHKQILALFRNPHYLGPNMALEKRGEPFIRDMIAEVFARWGRQVEWASVVANLPTQDCSSRRESALTSSTNQIERTNVRCYEREGEGTRGERPLTDPTGAPIPEYTV